MYFKINEEQEAIRKMVRDFREKEIVPLAPAWDEEERFPEEIIGKLDNLGLTNLSVPEEYGGPGVDFVSAAIIMEELAYGCAGVTLAAGNNTIALYPVVVGGTEAQKEQYLTAACDEGKLAALALWESEAGTDLTRLAATAQQDGEVYVLNGSKTFVTNAPYADFFLVFAKTGGEKGKDLSVFLVEKETPGISIGAPVSKLGLRAALTADVVFENVRVPAENLIGKEGSGYSLAAQTFELARPLIAAMAVGVAQAAMEQAAKYAQERVQFGRPIADFQAIRVMLAGMAAGIEASRLLTYQAAWLRDEAAAVNSKGAIARFIATEATMKTTIDAIQIMGGYGYSREYPLEKYMRDAKMLQVIEGDTQAQQLFIAAELLK
ncbi:MAG: acyl-CoA dehydrogenase family protein [Bacillota bacterium]